MVSQLSAMELRVLQWAADGLSNKQIALQSNRSMETVKTQLVTGRRKLGARNTKHAIAIAFRRGLID